MTLMRDEDEEINVLHQTEIPLVITKDFGIHGLVMCLHSFVVFDPIHSDNHPTSFPSITD